MRIIAGIVQFGEMRSFFSVGMRMEKKVPQKRFGMQTIFYLLPHEDSIIENFI
jgi:hypothetical protein